MNRIKTHLLLLILAAAGTARAQIKWSAHAGLVNTGIYVTGDRTGGPVYNNGTGFTAGGAITVQLYKSLHTEGGLSVTQKKINIESAPFPDFYSRYHFLFNYLSFSQDLLVKLPATKNLSFAAGAGFFVAAAFRGTAVKEMRTLLGSTREEGGLDIGNDDGDDLRPVDAGASLMVRSQYKRAMLTVRFNPSVTSFVPGSDNSSEKLRSLSFTLGWQF